MPAEPITSRRDPLQNESSMYSIGTAFAVDGLERFFSLQGNRTDLILINLMTLIRNHLSIQSDVSKNELFRRLQSEVFILTDELAAMLSSVRSGGSIVLYIQDYAKCIPKDMHRPPNKQRAILDEFSLYVRSSMDKLLLHHVAQYASVHLDVYTGRVPGYKHLLTKLRRLSIGDSIMLSHVALDYHIGTHLKNFKLIDSHTGNVRSMEQVGPKLFGKPIPFNYITHPLLGDKTHLKSPLKIKEKRLLYADSEENHWETKSIVDIATRVQRLGFKVPMNLK